MVPSFYRIASCVSSAELPSESNSDRSVELGVAGLLVICVVRLVVMAARAESFGAEPRLATFVALGCLASLGAWLWQQRDARRTPARALESATERLMAW